MKSKVLNVRISDKLYLLLSNFATLSDRSMSQICRYAISALDSDAPVELLDGSEESSTTTVSFRITEDDIQFVNRIAAKYSVSVSDVVRFSLHNWLANKSSQSVLLAGTNSDEVGVNG